jgi:signal transduction histidine kinase
MFRVKSKTSLRLIIGFLVITLIMVLTALFAFVYYTRNADRTLSEITRKGAVINDALQATFHIREKHEYQAHLIMSKDFSYVQEFNKAVSRTNVWLARLDTELTGPPERALYSKLIAANQAFDRVFHDEIIAAVRAGDEKETLRVHERSERARAQIIHWNNGLIDHLKEEIDRARGMAAATREYAVKATVIVIGLTTLLAILIGLNVSLSIMRPIQALIKGTESVSRGDFTHRIHLKRSDEFGTLAESFNHMTDKLREHREKLVQSEKMASLGQLAAGVAHEINNPLGVILGYLRVMLEDKDESDEDHEDLKVLEEEAQQCKSIVEDLLALSRPVGLSKEAVDLDDIIEEELLRIRNRQTGNHVEIIKDISHTPLVLFTERKKLKQVISNVLSNSLDAMPNGGTIRLRAFESTSPTIATMDTAFGPDAGCFLIMEFSDTGCGIPAENMNRIFDPFFTTKEDGTGLGLSIIYGIIKAHNGLIDVESTPGKGTTLIVNIPFSGDAGAAGDGDAQGQDPGN